MSAKVKNLKTLKYGRLTVLSDTNKRTKFGSVIWNCVCDCGNYCEVDASNLGKGTNSCGCYKKEYKRKNKLNESEASLNGLYYEYIRNAKRRKKEFELTKEQFKNITSESCYYCNKPPSKIFYKEGCNGEYVYNGIDRRDNTKGYILSNVVSCCYKCNTIKGEHLSEDEMLLVVRTLKNFRGY